jgi:ABC-type sugar transport system ATPase subunit
MMREYVEQNDRLVLFSTSELEEALQIADAILVLKNKKYSMLIPRGDARWNAESIVAVM